MKKINYIVMVLTVILTFSIFLRTDVFTSSTHQVTGVNQRVFDTMVEADCRLCHENPDQFPVEPWPLAYRHHLLNSTVIPDPNSAPYGIPGMLFECLSCHARDNSSGFLKFLVEKDCTVCHGATAHRNQHESTNVVCTTCHQSNLQNAHTNNCDLCHASTVPEVQDAIAAGNTDCAACHVFASHEEQHDMTMIDSTDCLDCHVADVITEHVTDRSLDCGVCHESTRPEVQDAIMLGRSGVVVYCSNCHGSTSHSAQHESTNTDCTVCHQSNLQGAHSNNCDLCHASTDPEVQDAITTGNTDCSTCHAFATHEEQHDMTVTDSPDCRECHVDNLLTEHVTNRSLQCSVCHESHRQDIQSAITRGTSGETIFCSDCHGFTSHRVQHESTNTDCTACHQSNLQDAHSNNCDLCHASSVPEVQDAIATGNTDCAACHSLPPHAESCELCHDDKSFSEYSGQGEQIHSRHKDKVICGICHDIPQSIDIGPQNDACANLCHGSESYSTFQDIHKKHMSKFKNLPNPCYWCHGLSVPQRPADICTLCHTDESGDANAAHDKHDKKFDCTACHESVAGFGPDVRFDPSRQVCTFCHTPESGDAPGVHEKHINKAQCYICHGDSNVYASFRGDKDCTICHDPESESFDRIHKKHAGKAMMCTVCHSIVPPNVDGIK